MAHYLNRGPIITVADPLHLGQYKQFRNPEWDELPEIISFTEFLRWNYTADYGRYIRELHRNGRLPLLYSIPPTAAIENVAVVEGKYDRIDHFTFLMYVICDVVFMLNGHRQNQKYCVQGHYRTNGCSDFFSDIDLYTGKYIRCQNPLDEFLVPILSKRDFDEIAKQIIDRYYPHHTNYPCRINGFAIAREMGYTIQYAVLSRNGSVRSKIIFSPKDVAVYDAEGEKRLLRIEYPAILIDESIKGTGSEQNAVIHECVHAYLHNLFYDLQSYYRRIVGKNEPDFNDYFYSKNQQKCMKWMETQANSITCHIQMPAEETTDVIIDYLDRIPGEPDWDGYRELIDMVKWKFGVARNAAKKRMIELGWKEVRGVYVYNVSGYVDDYDVDWRFPMDYTYTLSLRHISEIYGASEDFAALIRTKKFIYVDGHVVINSDKYVRKINEFPVGLTEYARHNIAECCLDFKRVYGEYEYGYTYGELHKDELTPITPENRCLTPEQIKKLHIAMYEITDENEKLGNMPTTNPFGQAVIFHMERCGLTTDQLADRSGMGVNTINKMRSGKKVKLETVLAFCVALELEETFRVDLMQKANVGFDTNIAAHRMYLMIFALLPKANVFQINQMLREEGLTPWTQEREQKKRYAKGAAV